MSPRILLMWSECPAICGINSYCPHSQHVSAYIAPCGQSVSRYVVSIHTVHIASMSPHILLHVARVSRDMLYQFILFTSPACLRMSRIYCPMWSELLTIYCPMWPECLAICCINSYCSHSQLAPAYIAHVARMSRDMLYQFILSTWPTCPREYCPMWSRVARHILLRAVSVARHMASMSPHILLHVVSASPHILPRVARVSRDTWHQSILFT